MTGLPPPPPSPGSPQSSRLRVTKPGKCSKCRSAVHRSLASTQDPREPRFQRPSAGSQSGGQPPPPAPARGPAHSLAGPAAAGAKGTGRSGLPSPPPTWGRLSAKPGRRHRASLLCPAGGAAPPGMGEGRHGVRWSPEFPGAGPRERGASGCVHAPLTELLAAGQPLITRGPASSLAEASHTFAADWPTPGPALYPRPRRGAGRAATCTGRGADSAERGGVDV